MAKLNVQIEKSRKGRKTSSEREWSKKYVHGLLGEFWICSEANARMVHNSFQ
jgi:hypothetical protein